MRWDVVDRYQRVVIDLLSDWMFWERLGNIAPIVTAIIALTAASIAWRAITVQRDTARRRAAIDFFLKTETEEKLIDLYEKFKELKPQLRAIKTSTDYENFKKKKDECKQVRAFLNLLELIAVGVNQKAFSDIVSYDYWQDVLLSGWEASRGFIGLYRKDATEHGTDETYKELEILYRMWKVRADKAGKKDRAVAVAQST